MSDQSSLAINVTKEKLNSMELSLFTTELDYEFINLINPKHNLTHIKDVNIGEKVN